MQEIPIWESWQAVTISVIEWFLIRSSTVIIGLWVYYLQEISAPVQTSMERESSRFHHIQWAMQIHWSLLVLPINILHKFCLTPTVAALIMPAWGHPRPGFPSISFPGRLSTLNCGMIHHWFKLGFQHSSMSQKEGTALCQVPEQQHGMGWGCIGRRSGTASSMLLCM